MGSEVKNKEAIRKGIAEYAREQNVFCRLLRKRGTFTEDEFDSWFRDREWRRPVRLDYGLDGDSFILGMGENGGNLWAERLELLQYMVVLGIIDAKTVRGKVVYSLNGKPEVPMSRSTAWKKANPERHREYMREYMRKRRARSRNVPNP